MVVSKIFIKLCILKCLFINVKTISTLKRQTEPILTHFSGFLFSPCIFNVRLLTQKEILTILHTNLFRPYYFRLKI